MNIKHTFKQIDASEAVRYHAEDRLEKLNPHLTKQDSIHLIYKKVRNHEYSVDIVISGHQKVFSASAKSTDDFYAALDLCLPKLVRQLAKKKERLKHHRHYEVPNGEPWHDTVVDEHENDYSQVAGFGNKRAA